MIDPILKLSELSKYYTDASQVNIGVDRVSLEFTSGEFVAITGESGSGKSTLSHVIAGILPFESGEMYYEGTPTSQFSGIERDEFRRDAVSFISQSYGIIEGLSAAENIQAALSLSGKDRKTAKEEAMKILEKVDLVSVAGRTAKKLSSGQKQRLSIARALAKPSKILIADEPTGNLDAENSRSIAKLLKEASKDHLVIMVTHDFEEVDGLVTRHVVMRNGAVVRDTVLETPEECQEIIKKPRKKAHGLSLYTAFLQIRAERMMNLLFLLFFAAAAFGCFAFLGNFISSLDDTATRVYDNAAFRNGDERRIAVARIDGTPFTEEDFDVFLDVPHVEEIERFGYLQDMNYAYREDIDYRARYGLTGNSQEELLTKTEGLTFENTELFLKTIPCTNHPEYFLSAGRMPENLYEVVAADPALLGASFPVFIQNRKDWSPSYYIRLDVTVVGTSAGGSHLYFHESLGPMMMQAFKVLNEENKGKYLRPFFIPSTAVGADEVLISPEMLRDLPSDHGQKYVQLMTLDQDTLTLYVAGNHDSKYPLGLVVSEENYARIIAHENQNQISLTITDHAYAARVIKDLQKAGFSAISPYELGATRVNSAKAKERMQTLIISLSAFLVTLFMQIIVLRGMFMLQAENYRLLSHIGLSEKTAGRSILLQHLIFCILGQILGAAGIFICFKLGVTQIERLVYHLPIQYVFVLLFVNLVSCMLSAFIVRIGMIKAVYPFAGSVQDLPEGGAV